MGTEDSVFHQGQGFMGTGTPFFTKDRDSWGLGLRFRALKAGNTQGLVLPLLRRTNRTWLTVNMLPQYGRPPIPDNNVHYRGIMTNWEIITPISLYG